MSRRRAAKAARLSIQNQLTDKPNITENEEPKPSKQVKIKQEPQDEEIEETWSGPPVTSEQHNDDHSGNSHEELEEKTNGSIVAKNHPVMLKKMGSSDNNDQVPDGTAGQTTDMPSLDVASLPKMSVSLRDLKAKVPLQSGKVQGKVQVKVLKACPKCVPVVMELAEKSNQATKEIQEQKKLIKQYKDNIDLRNTVVDQTFRMNESLRHHMGQLKQNMPFIEMLMESNFLVQVFCGLNFVKQLNWLCEKARLRLGQVNVDILENISLSDSEQLVVVLMFLKSNPPFEELVHRFQFRITPMDIMTLLHVWLPVLSDLLKPRIMKPQIYILNTNFPKCFESVGRNLQGIVHKVELIREKPALWDAGQTSHCLKCLFALSLKGSVMAVSQVVDTSVVDVELFTLSDLYGLFGPTNMIIDSQAIGVSSVVPFGVKVIEPPFAEEGFTAAACDHIENIVSKLLAFRILQGPIPRTLTKDMIDQVVIVCSGLVNLADESQSHL